jgi:hypothetical protein
MPLMKIFSLIFFSIFYVFNVEGSETVGGCLFSLPTVITEQNNWLEKCPLAIAASGSTVELEKKYRNNLNEKLAKSIAAQTKQILEDLGASSEFYEQSSESFLMEKESSVGKSCKFGFIAQIEKKGCGNNGLTAEEIEKLKMISNSLAGNKDSNSLLDSFLHVYAKNKYGNNIDESQKCPLADSAGPLYTQITNASSVELIEQFKLNSNEVKINKYYTAYPQLSMIIDAEKFHPGFKDKFEKYIKAFNPDKDNPKKYFSQFFFDDVNKKILEKGVAHQCEQVRSSISSFVCHSLNNSIPTDSLVSKKLFDGYDINKDFSNQSKLVRVKPGALDLYAYKCFTEGSSKSESNPVIPLAQSGNKDPNFCTGLKAKDDTVDNWYRCFNEGIRPAGITADNSVVDNFCSMYTCKNPAVKNTPSCKAGGPLSSVDLEMLKLKDDTIASQIAYMLSLENHAKKKERYQSLPETSLANESYGTSEIKKQLSDFDLNAFGAEAVMKFQNIPSTEIAISQVNQEMKEKGIAPLSTEQFQKIVNRETEPAYNDESNVFPTTTSSLSEVASTPFIGNNVESRIENPKSSTNSMPESTSAKDRTNYNDSNTNNDKMTKNLSDTEQMIKDLKEIMKPSPAATETPASTQVTSKNANADNALNSWAQSLRNKESALNERESLANLRDSDYWRRESDLRSRENQLSNRLSDSRGDTGNKKLDDLKAQSENRFPAAGNGNGNKEDSKALRLKQDQVDMNVTSSGLIVTPEKLDKLEKKDLTNYGVNIEEPFVISVRMHGKLIHVRVAKVSMKGKIFLAPRLNEDNKEIKEVIMKSPLFKEFRYYFEKEQSSYFPVK